MVSNAASPNSGSLPKAKVCKPPPPPPPPGYQWPPSTFPLEYAARWQDPYGRHQFAVYIPMDNGDSGYQWAGELIAPPNHYYGSWYVDPETRLALLQLNFTHDGEHGYSNLDGIPVVWGTPTYYHIYVWDEQSPALASIQARFTF